VLSVDVMDIAGETQNDLAHDIYKTRLDSNGNQIHVEKAQGTTTITYILLKSTLFYIYIYIYIF